MLLYIRLDAGCPDKRETFYKTAYEKQEWGSHLRKSLYRLNALKLNEAVVILYYLHANIWMSRLYINGVYKCRKTIRIICDRNVVMRQ